MPFRITVKRGIVFDMNEKSVLVSGVKPTGDLHIGNYFGAMRQFVELQEKYKSYVFIADYHALTTSHPQRHPDEVRASIRHIALGYLAIGLDPKKVVFFKQSDVPAHTELAWIFNCLTTMPYLMRAHAYKDAEAKNKEISVGTFDYPMLMAADILLYDPAVVPVGRDQKQHVEFARDTAQKFNSLYGETFAVPEPLILDSTAVVPGTDGQKMSKSYGNVIPLFADHDELARCVMGIVTDSSGERPQNVYALHKLVKSEEELAPIYAEHEGNYKALKEMLIEDLDRYLAPMRTKYEELKNDSGIVDEVLESGKREARAVSEAKMERVRKAIGVA
ncbi:MAG: Tryptophan-tRNA ligase [Parcubacteria group bacterium GW2011_GWA1_54_9]|nr:MAG: Tryptophan-tRNA ligase [Parcubacteria group bacterium GW2011_GWA1_54_9]KKW41524.1 MAG: Tryptophan-tRNA ligase [Parcubacteria group bacterium GW2011_GWB1_55_9]